MEMVASTLTYFFGGVCVVVMFVAWYPLWSQDELMVDLHLTLYKCYSYKC
jgi:hypothetical protein